MERGKPEYQEKNLSAQGREPTTNSTHIWRRRRDLNPSHIGGRRVLSPLRHPCNPRKKSSWGSEMNYTFFFLPQALEPSMVYPVDAVTKLWEKINMAVKRQNFIEDTR